MKQYITYEQMCELDNKKLSILANLRVDLFEFVKEANANQGFNIGKMIEILEENYPKIDYDFFDGIGFTWIVEVTIKKEAYVYTNDVLCDALWQAVKEVIK